jgi:hypothetical protein
MNKAKLNYKLFWILLGLFILNGLTGIVKLFNIKGPILNNIHDWAGLVLIIVLIVHIILHWKWIITMTKRI